MNDTALILCFRKCSSYGFFNACQPICAYNEDVFHTSILQTIQDRKPVLGTFIFTNFNRQYFFVSVIVDSKNNISCKLSDDTIITDRIMDCIDIQN